jgi:hypothetical protein
MEANDRDFTTWEDAFGRRNMVARTADRSETDEEWRLAPWIAEQALTPPIYVQAYLDWFDV